MKNHCFSLSPWSHTKNKKVIKCEHFVPNWLHNALESPKYEYVPFLNAFGNWELGHLLGPSDSHIQMNGFTTRGLQLVHLSSKKFFIISPHTRQCMGLFSLLFVPGFGITRPKVSANLMDKMVSCLNFYVLGFGYAWHLFLDLLTVWMSFVNCLFCVFFLFFSVLSYIYLYFWCLSQLA